MDDYGNGAFREPAGPQQENKLFRYLAYVPAAAFALYSVLLFLLYLAPVISLGYAGVAEGAANVYRAELPACTSLVVFAVLSLLTSLAGLALLPYPFFDLAKKSERIALPLRKVFSYLPFLFYFIFYTISCVLAGAVGTLVGIGSGIASTSSVAPGLILGFTVVFALIHAVCLLLPKLRKA